MNTDQKETKHALPEKYKWLQNEPGPKMIKWLTVFYGITETIGEQDNPIILEWARELKLKQYVHDSIAWCGLFMAILAKRAEKKIVKDPLWAANWLHFGQKVDQAMLGDVLVFKRPGGNHVGLYVAEDPETYHVGGGNQGDKVCVARIERSRCIGIRRPTYTNQPTNVRKIFIDPSGMISTNES